MPGRIDRLDTQHTHHTAGGLERLIAQNGFRQGFRPMAGHLAVFEDPSRHGMVIIGDGQAGTESNRFQAVPDRQEDDHLPAEGLPDMGNGGQGDSLQVCGDGQIPAELVQRDGLHFAPLDSLSLFTNLDGQLADHQTNRQEPQEGQQIFGI